MDMTFTRTSGGLTAQNFFYDSEYMVYIEGKDKESTGTTYDEKYYKTILGFFLPRKKTTIKIVGSCNDVLAIYKKVLDSNLKNTICIIDRDYVGVKLNYICDFRLIKTYGYSWENDFWSSTLCNNVLMCLTNDSADASNELKYKIKHASKRLAFLHKINISCSFLGLKVFNLGAKGGDNGITYDANSNFLVSKLEIKRILLPLKNHPEKKDIISIYKKISLPPERLIQGHYFEYITLRAIRDIAKKHSPGNTTAPEKTIKNISFSEFMRSPLTYLPATAIAHYQSKLKHF
ncbi:UNVERIFIED_ORG: hypothetical protein M2414_003748 [Rahnella aquatilis]